VSESELPTCPRCGQLLPRYWTEYLRTGHYRCKCQDVKPLAMVRVKHIAPVAARIEAPEPVIAETSDEAAMHDAVIQRALRKVKG